MTKRQGIEPKKSMTLEDGNKNAKESPKKLKKIV
jgi:hypothetical protein